jgi:hypothetical protein
MHEVVSVQFKGKTFKDVVRGSWQSTVARIINRNENRKANAFTDCATRKTLGKDLWVCFLNRSNARGTVIEFTEDMTVSLEQVN